MVWHIAIFIQAIKISKQKIKAELKKIFTLAKDFEVQIFNRISLTTSSSRLISLSKTTIQFFISSFIVRAFSSETDTDFTVSSKVSCMIRQR